MGVLVSPLGSGGGGGSGLGYAIPMDTVRGLVDQVLLYGKPMRPSLGITFAPPQVGLPLPLCVLQAGECMGPLSICRAARGVGVNVALDHHL